MPAPKQLPSLPKKQGELETALGACGLENHPLCLCAVVSSTPFLLLAIYTYSVRVSPVLCVCVCMYVCIYIYRVLDIFVCINMHEHMESPRSPIYPGFSWFYDRVLQE